MCLQKYAKIKYSETNIVKDVESWFVLRKNIEK